MKSEFHKPESKITPFQVFLLALSLYVLAALFVEAVFKIPPPIATLLKLFDTSICFIFLGDFFYRLYHAQNRLAFIKWGWIDLVSSIPNLPFFRWGRMVRVIRIFRLLRGVRSAKFLLNMLLENRRLGTFSLVAFPSLVLVIFASIAMLNLETDPESNIRTPGDALWWAVATVTTIGYGDKFPVTAEGRVVAAFVMVAGVGLFGTFTGCVASFVLKGKHEDDTDAAMLAEVRLVRERLESLERRLSGMEPTLPAQFGRGANTEVQSPAAQS